LEEIAMTFGAPEWLWGLLLIPLLIALFVRSEHRGLKRLQQFVSARLLPQLAGTVNRPRRILRFGLLLLGLALAIVSLAQPRWGYTFEDVKRKGLDLLVAVDTSRSMLSNDVQPNRLDRVKLAIQDLIGELQGDRVGLIAFAGRSFLQAPLTIDYDAVIEAVNDLDTKTIPEGGTNISSAITLATQSFGKSAMGNRALIIFTDGEDLSGDAVKTAKAAAADAGVRIFTVGVGTPQGSLIPVTGDNGETNFVKDSAGVVHKSKLDDKRLREVAEATGGFYLHLENGPRTMQQIQNEGLAKMQAAEMDVRLSRRPIERYEWPLGGALIALALSILIPERKKVRERSHVPAPARNAARTVPSGPVKAAGAAVAVLMLLCSSVFATAPGVNAYQQGKFEDAYKEFQDTLKSHPQSRAEDELQFDSGAAAYKLKDYNKALESFSQALLTPDTGLQTKGHYNLGNTLYQRGEMQKSDDKKLSDWTNALDHYEQTLKLDPQNKEAKDNYEYVKKKIDELKNKKEQQQPSPSPTPPQKNKQNKQDQKQKQQDQQNQDQQQQQQKDQQQKDQKDQKDQQQQQQQQQQNQNQQEQKDQQQAQNQQSQDKSGSDKDKKEQQQKDQSQAKNEPQKKQQQQPGESPSPSPGAEKQQDNQHSPSPSPGQQRAEQSPSPGEGENEEPSPSPGEGAEENASPTPAESPQKKFAGEVKGAGGDNSQKPPDKNEQMAAEAEQEKEGQMSERQALALLESMKDEEARVRLDERKVKRHVYNDW
jgi:Ca-activated chloride channel family protein